MTEATALKPRDPRALNAYRHGLTGQIVILTPADQVAYDRHCQGVRQSLAPEGALETSLAQAIADDRWRLQRACAIDHAGFALAASRPGQIVTEHPEVSAALAQAAAWAADARNLNLLTLYEGRIQRRVEKNMLMLHNLQQQRRAALERLAEEAALLAQAAALKGEAYKIERDFPTALLPPQFDFSLARIARLAAHYQRLDDARQHLESSRKPVRRAA